MSRKIEVGKTVVWYYGEEHLVIAIRPSDNLIVLQQLNNGDEFTVSFELFGEILKDENNSI